MENRKKNNSQTRCKKHPKHQQSPGVCSICLREKLSQISTSSSSSRKVAVSYCSSSSYLSSLSSSSHCSSSELSPARYRVRTTAKWSKNNVFGKSRSMAFVGELGEGKKKKSGGFWSRLLRPMSHKKSTHDMDVGFVHSRTMRERVLSTRVH
ncbi:hypothetical protein Vadar_010239 [Vaccinium darrowii]|uniref:Uncharacterized protein n=1 Tax=Vaccinium darrowii TaxID=229202 RepID=A0ACB7Y7D0_9ERIC|nr:hypothetical protein Vadar_010239 [Vaccinium darrowii]